MGVKNQKPFYIQLSIILIVYLIRLIICNMIKITSKLLLYDLTHDSPLGEVKLKFNFIILHHPFIFDKVYNFFITFIIM